MKEIMLSLEIPTGDYDSINNLKQLILSANKFRKDDLGIRYASIDK